MGIEKEIDNSFAELEEAIESKGCNNCLHRKVMIWEEPCSGCHGTVKRESFIIDISIKFAIEKIKKNTRTLLKIIKSEVGNESKL